MPATMSDSQNNTASRVKLDSLARMEIVLDHPVEKVWPLVLHWDRWVDDKDYQAHRVGGTLDTEGETKRITHFDETGRVDSAFFVRVTKIIPHRQLVYKILSPYSTYDAVTGACTNVPMTGYEVMDLNEDNGQTALRVFIYAESEHTDIPMDQVSAVASDYTASTEKAWNEKYFPRLRQVLSKS